MARILAVGIATLDVINEVDGYPAEDEEVRAVSLRRQCGGNAANTLAVLSQLGHECYLVSTLPEPGLPGAREVLDDLRRHRVDLRFCRRVASGTLPTSHIWVNRRNGSRTIVHYRDFPELELADFERIELDGFDWVHFEGRNVEETALMMAEAQQRRPSLPRSLEVEKARSGIDALLPMANAIFFSAVFARAHGFDDGAGLLRSLQSRLPNRTLVCSWGERGATGVGAGGDEARCAAEAPARVVDTLGAGDVFNAGVIDGLVGGGSLGDALSLGCRLAGAKCARRGLGGLDSLRSGKNP